MDIPEICKWASSIGSPDFNPGFSKVRAPIFNVRRLGSSCNLYRFEEIHATNKQPITPANHGSSQSPAECIAVELESKCRSGHLPVEAIAFSTATNSNASFNKPSTCPESWPGRARVSVPCRTINTPLESNAEECEAGPRGAAIVADIDPHPPPSISTTDRCLHLRSPPQWFQQWEVCLL